ncbi:MAG: DUF2807 domain-containing protein [Saprospiraceae bacterium]|nr:DUF2807 domain-containing protein [Saprospiraceae bacterium]|tara:strand:- start:1859 stop:2563 length:705 start_codon:yes stop_codon:yes gene_type:complete
MKKVTFLNLFLFIILSSVTWAFPTLETEVRNLEEFSKLSVATGINLVLVPGDKNSAEIEATNIDLDDVLTKIDGNKLIVKVKGWNINFNKKRKVKIDVTLTYTDLKQVSASSGASLNSSHTLTNEHLDLHASSGASMELDIEGNQVEASASTGAFIKLTGECNALEAIVNTGAGIKSSGLEAATVEAKASTGSEIQVWATESLFAKANTGGEVRYKGDPDVRKKKGTGGSVRKN